MRLIIRVLSLSIAFIACSCSTVPEYKVARKHDILTTIMVVDESGRPIPSAEVWRIVVPPPQSYTTYSKRAGTSNPPLDYMDYLVKRYRDVPEFASYRGSGFVNPLPNPLSKKWFESLTPTNENGLTQEIIKYQTGRPSTVASTYAALNYGYIPAAIHKEIKKDESELKIKIVLKRDMTVTLPIASYWAKYEEVRWRVSGGNWKSTEANIAREELIHAAEYAEKSGDNIAAARIYSWVPYIRPELYIPPKTYPKDSSGYSLIAGPGYKREDERSTRNIELLKKAAALDPDNRYIQMKLFLLTPSANREQRIKVLEELINERKDDVWPEIFIELEELYYSVGLKQKSYQQFLEFKTLDPFDFRNQTDVYKARLIKHITVDEFVKEYILGNDPNKEDEYRHAPIFYAIKSGRVDIFEWLSNKNVKLPNNSMHLAIDSGNPEMVRKVLGSYYRGDLDSYIQIVEHRIKSEPENADNLIEIRQRLIDKK